MKNPEDPWAASHQPCPKCHQTGWHDVRVFHLQDDPEGRPQGRDGEFHVCGHCRSSWWEQPPIEGR